MGQVLDDQRLAPLHHRPDQVLIEPEGLPLPISPQGLRDSTLDLRNEGPSISLNQPNPAAVESRNLDNSLQGLPQADLKARRAAEDAQDLIADGQLFALPL